MTTDDMDIVSALRTALADKVGEERFKLWFGANTRFALSKSGLVITVSNLFYLNWIRNNFRSHIEQACQTTLGTCPKIEYSIDASLAETNEERTAEPAAVASTPAPVTSSAEKAVAIPTSWASLDSFIVGHTNRLAMASAEMVVRSPGRSSPLVIYGPTGVGKTHLLQGIVAATRKHRPTARAIYLSAEQFTTSFLEALRGSGLPNFRRKYRGVDLLVIDDLHFLTGKQATLVELLYTIDEALREGRQLVFSLDRAPNALTDWAPELMARLSGGMTALLEPPDYATRRAIVEQMAARMGIIVPQDVQEYIASRLTNHAREISGALCRLQATHEALGRPITRALAEESLAEMIRQGSRTVGLADIEKAVCDVLQVQPSGLQSACRAKSVSYPRMLAMWLARKHTRAPLQEIGQYFGHRSHSTVVSAQKQVDSWMSSGMSIDVDDQRWTVDETIRVLEKRLLVG